MVVAAMVLGTVPQIGAEPRHRPRRDRSADGDVADVLAVIGPLVEALGATPESTEDGPRLLAEALRSGDTDLAAWASVIRWVLTEKEAKVAAGFAQVLGEAPLAGEGAEGERWDATTRAVVGALAGVLQDAQDHRRRDGDQIARDLVTAAGPAVLSALQRSDPAALESAARTIRAFAPMAREMVLPLAGALRDENRSIRLGAASLLGALGPEARAALPDLLSAREDPDPRVRDAVASALREIAPR